MSKLGLMTQEEVQNAKQFDIYETGDVDAMGWSWTVAGRIALGVAGAFL